MAADDAGTLAALDKLRTTRFGLSVRRRNGRNVKLTGDGALVEFGSVVDAVNCATTIQMGLVFEDRPPVQS